MEIMSGSRKLMCTSFAVLLLVSLVWADIGPKAVLDKKEKEANLPPCRACTVLVNSFNLGLEKTAKGGHGGGDADWEQKKMKAYGESEVRLVEIQEQLCKDVHFGQEQCFKLATENEDLFDEWFLEKQSKHPNFHEWLCIEQLKVCCPEGHYGPQCKECMFCFGNGKCKGSGTRKGNGKCKCDAGYTGDQCNECAHNYYESFRDDSKLLCSLCHKSCNEGCTGAGPKNCKKCKPGWYMHADHGCMDINECVKDPKICKPDQFCVNDAGSYSCLECDRSCDGCDGDGPDMCRRCAKGYELKNGKCEDVSEEKRDSYVNFTRFLTYFGLCVATCVIFQSSTYIAYIVGAAVAIYIAASEYWLNTTPQAGAKPQFDTKQLEEMIMKNL